MRVLALDVGDRRIGLAVSDATGTIAKPLGVVRRKDPHSDVHRVLEWAVENQAQLIVVGMPVTLRGQKGTQACKVEAFVEELRKHSPVPVETWDERYSTQEAERLLREAGKKPSRDKALVDSAAAAVILQSYLEAHRQGLPP